MIYINKKELLEEMCLYCLYKEHSVGFNSRKICEDDCLIFNMVSKKKGININKKDGTSKKNKKRD